MNLFVSVLLVCVLIYSVLYLLAREMNKPALGDHFWGISFIIVTVFCYLFRNFGYATGANWNINNLCYNQPLKMVENCPTQALSLSSDPYTFIPAILAGTLVILWAIRSSRHTLAKHLHNALDWRYANWRSVGKRTSVGGIFIQKYLLQACLLWVVSLPVQYLFTIEFESNTYHERFVLWPLIIGTVIWLAGYIYEGVADSQLRTFNSRKSNHGKILKKGLWKYSRHPNYFGEIVMWWGIFIMAFAAPVPALWLPLSPLVVTYLIRFVSGVPVLEKHYAHNKEYQTYKATTSAVLPWPRRR